MQKGRGKQSEPVTRGQSSPSDAPAAPAALVRSCRFVLMLLLGLAAIVVAADLVTKHLAGRALNSTDTRIIHVIPGCLRLQWTENRGAVFGMGQGKRGLFIAFTIVAVAGIIWVAGKHGRKSLLLTTGLGLLLGGALGNLCDRIVLAHVRDFILAYAGPYKWPTFNVADMAICAGAAAIILYSFCEPKAAEKG